MFTNGDRQNHFYNFYTLDVFTDQLFGGNPLAVFPEAVGLSVQRMGQIAKEFNLSETVFVFPSDRPDCEYKLRIFTPGGEIPFAGHPTVGTAFLLAHLGRFGELGDRTLITFEEKVGPVPVVISAEQGQVKSTELIAAQLPEFLPISHLDQLAAILSLNPEDLLLTTSPPMAISCGLPFLFVPLRDRLALDKSRVNLTLWENTLHNSPTPHLYPFVIDEINQQIEARMFAPALGISEDPATGSAATALAGYLQQKYAYANGEKIWQISQGVTMNRPSHLALTITIQDEKLTEIRVGGASVLVSQGQMNIPIDST